MINFHVSREDHDKIMAIVERAERQIPERAYGNKLTLLMDITACHANDVPLQLDELLTAPNFDFVHDVGGIVRHIDRETGKLGGCFLPRYAKRDS